MDIVCNPLIAALSDTAMLTITGCLVGTALAVFSFVYVFCTFPVSRQLENTERFNDEVLQQLKDLQESNDELRTVLRQKGILRSSRDVQSPGGGLKIDRGPA